MKVTILGPNLSREGCQKGSLHVHAAGCADIKRSARKNGYDLRHAAWTEEHASVKDVILSIYPADDFQYDPDGPEYDSYRGDVAVFPCVHLPEVIVCAHPGGFRADNGEWECSRCGRRFASYEAWGAETDNMDAVHAVKSAIARDLAQADLC